MTGKTNTISDVIDDQSQNVTVKIWSKTGAIFQEIFPVNQTKFAHVKYLAMQFLLKNSHLDEADNYKLISIQSKKTIDEQKTLGQERVKNGDEYLLAIKIPTQSTKVEQTSESSPINEKLINIRTKDLPVSSHWFLQAHQLKRRTEFRTDLNRILLTLIETSQKLLWYRSDAEQIFKQVEKLLSKSPIESNDIEIDPSRISKLIDMGFTEQQAQIALKRTKSDFNAAMELLLTQPDINDNENETKNLPSIYSHNGPFIPFRQFRQQYFQPNPTAIQSLKEMGFNHDDIIDALRLCHNDQNLTCDYLIGDKRQQQNIIDVDNEQGLDPNSRLFQVIMENPYVQRAINNPKIFFVMLQLYENSSLVTNFINEPEFGNMLLQISRIYHTERYQMDTSNSNQREETNSSIRIENESESEDLEDDQN